VSGKIPINLQTIYIAFVTIVFAVDTFPESIVFITLRHLENGKIVCFGDFGSFQVSLSSNGAETAEKFNQSLIKEPKVTFRPGIDLKDMLATLKYEKAK